jgi:acetylornithine deacetylase/succinyl-diaminopimelate desuccinylase-like protein
MMSLKIDRNYLLQHLQELARVPTDVPLGFDTLLEPDDPKLVHYVQEVMRPKLGDIGYADSIIDAPRNNLIAVAGSGRSGKSLLIQNYTPAQHNNLMDEPFSGKVAEIDVNGKRQQAVFGQGVSQNKAHQAVMLAVLKSLRDADISLDGTLYWAVNNEGRSSHECSFSIIEALPSKPDFCIVNIGTNLQLSIGNRGRVDILAHVSGSAAHSSEPENAHNAIEGAAEVISRLKTLKWADSHPILGGRHAIVYKVRYEPVAPHTLPSDAYMTIDRRLIPGDDIQSAVNEIVAAVGDLSPFGISIEADVAMLPSLVDPDFPDVISFQHVHQRVVGQPLETYYGRGTFDAGGPSSLGIPTVMYGASGGDGLLGADYVPVEAVEQEAQVLAGFVVESLGSVR